MSLSVLGHYRGTLATGVYLHFVLVPQPPQPDSFNTVMTAQERDSDFESRLRSVESLWIQTRGPYGLYVVLTPKGRTWRCGRGKTRVLFLLSRCIRLLMNTL